METFKTRFVKVNRKKLAKGTKVLENKRKKNLFEIKIPLITVVRGPVTNSIILVYWTSKRSETQCKRKKQKCLRQTNIHYTILTILQFRLF